MALVLILVLLGTLAVDHTSAEGGAHFEYLHHGADWTGTCATGSTQSPINIVSRDAMEVPQLGSLKARTNYPPIQSTVNVSHDGHTVKMTFAERNRARLPVFRSGPNSKPFAGTFDLLQCHLHLSSEHTIDGVSDDFCLHCVHARQSRTNRSESVYGVYEIGFSRAVGDHACDPFLAKVFAKLPQLLTVEKGTFIPVEAAGFSLKDLLPTDGSYFHYYPGSLTTPPCSEGLQWYVFKAPDPICQSQYDTYKAFEDQLNGNAAGNFRAVQPLNGRQVYHWTDRR